MNPTRILFALVLGPVLAHLASTSVYASSLTAATILNDFNAVVYTNASTPSDIEGAAVIGGNFKGATVYTDPTASQPAGYGALTVYGSTSGNLNINNGGSVYVGGSKGATVNFNGGGSYMPAPPNTIANFEAPLNALSTSLSTLAATGVLPTTGNNEVIKALPNSAGIAVFNITATQLAAIPSYQINMNGASTVIFNVSGSVVNFSANDESGATGANNIIWNFYNATSVNLVTQIAGTVLAPGANVSNGNQIEGTLVADSWTGSGELHDYGFTGSLPSTPSTPTPTPEPASWMALLLGLGVIASRLPARSSSGGADLPVCG
jgi:choice-of-anchor A domain-containing protein